MVSLAKDKVKYDIRKVKKVATWQLVLVLLLMLFLTATFLRLNNIGMMQRRDAVISADKAGDDEMLKNRLEELKRYSFSTMNANTGKFFLEYQYERDSTAILKKAEAEANAANPNGNVYKKASDVCDPLAKQWGWGYSEPYFNCITEELNKYSSDGLAQTTVELPNVSLYQLEYVSPIWTPSLAGFSALICLVLAVVIAVKLLILLVLKIILLAYK